MNANDHVGQSRDGNFHIWRLAKSFGVYNSTGVKLIDIPRNTLDESRAKRMAQLCADGIEQEFQR